MELADKLAEEMAEEGLSGKTLTLKLKTTAFEVRTRAYTLAQHIHTAEDIRNVALRLLQAELPVEIRLMVRSWLANSSVNGTPLDQDSSAVN